LVEVPNQVQVGVDSRNSISNQNNSYLFAVESSNAGEGGEEGEEGEGKPAFTVLLHGSLKVGGTVAVVQLG
jgi:hypothetical protein